MPHFMQGHAIKMGQGIADSARARGNEEIVLGGGGKPIFRYSAIAS